MLKFIISGIGGGKTTEIMNIIQSNSSNESELMTLIVPEQFSFTCQKNALALIGPEKMTRLDVLSFTELGEKLIGKPAIHQRRRLTDSAAAILMSMTLSDVKDDLKLYSRHAERRSTASEFISLSSEFKQNGISCDTIKEVADKMEDGLLKAKLCDIATVLSAYDERVARSYFNPHDLLTELSEVAELDAYLNGRTVFIDSFRGFTAQEYHIIEHILTCAKDVYISLCTYDINCSDDITELFAKTKDTASRVIRFAEKSGMKYEAVNVTDKGFNPYNTPELTHLEKNLYASAPEEFESECGSITLCRATDIYQESAYVASNIKKLLRSGDYRCRDIAVIARTMSTYEAPLRSALKKCGISIYEDYRKSADTSPVINIISAALAAASGNFDSDSVMRYLKTGLTGISDDDIAELENYCFIWQISGSKWFSEWTQNPDGFVKEENEKRKAKNQALLDKLNRTRQAVITPLKAFKDDIKGGKMGSEAVEALWKFIVKTDLAENVKKMAKKLEEDNETGVVKELDRMWNLLIDIIDEMAVLTADEKITAEKLSNIFETMLSVQTVGSIPQGLDEVVIGSADRIRISGPKVVFVMGANEDVFPPAAVTGSSLTLKDRARMKDLGLELSGNGEWKLAEEKLIAYNSVCCAREKLFVTCTAGGADGNAMSPCEFYNRIKEIFPACKEEETHKLDNIYFCEGTQAAFEQLAKADNEVFKTTAGQYFSSVPEYEGRLTALDRSKRLRSFHIENQAVAKELFGEKMCISASKVETYYSCPFMYFCKYGIKANPIKKIELDFAQTGTISHYVLENLLSKYHREGMLEISDDELMNEINALMDAYYNEVLENPEDERLRYLFDRLRGSLFEISKRLIEEFEHCCFEPVDFELPIGKGETIEAYEPDCGDGTVTIRGFIDRVDKAVMGDNCYLRIVDYKSKQKEFSLGNVLQGLNMQMLIYLFALWKNGGVKYGDNIIPAGVLYYNATTPVVPVEPGTDDQAIKKARIDKEKMTGIVLEDLTVIHLMEEDAQGIFIPASYNAEKGSIEGEVISLTAMKKLKEKTDMLIVQMGRDLHEGLIDAYPSGKSDSKLPCSYCDYKTVCGYEDGIPYKQLYIDKQYRQNKTKNIIKDYLTEGDENGN